MDLLGWNKDHFDHIQSKLKVLDAQLKNVHSKNLSSFDQNLEKALASEFDEQLTH